MVPINSSLLTITLQFSVITAHVYSDTKYSVPSRDVIDEFDWVSSFSHDRSKWSSPSFFRAIFQNFQSHVMNESEARLRSENTGEMCLGRSLWVLACINIRVLINTTQTLSISTKSPFFSKRNLISSHVQCSKMLADTIYLLWYKYVFWILEVSVRPVTTCSKRNLQ